MKKNFFDCLALSNQKTQFSHEKKFHLILRLVQFICYFWYSFGEKNHFSHIMLLNSYMVLRHAMECGNQVISLILLHHNFFLCFEVLHKKTTASIVYPCETATKTTTKWAWGRRRHPRSNERGCKEGQKREMFSLQSEGILNSEVFFQWYRAKVIISSP